MSALSSFVRRGHVSSRDARGSQVAVRRSASSFEPLEDRVLMSAVRMDAAFNATSLGVGDDRSTTTAVSLGFSSPVNFFGSLFSSVFVNNNGNLSFGVRNSAFSSSGLDALQVRMIAPFFADVDTRFAGSPVRYGRGTVDGRTAFGVNFINVDYFTSSPSHTNRNSFQVVLIDRSDLGAGNFDVEFNYDKIQWETGTNYNGGSPDGRGGASGRVGFTAGTRVPGTFYDMPGGGIAGSFLDGNLETGLVHGSFMSDVAGRYVFRFRDGTWADAGGGEAPNTVPTLTLPDSQILVEGRYGDTPLPWGVTGLLVDPDADNWALTVDYGDGSGVQPLMLNADMTYTLDHSYASPGLYTVTVTADDGNGGMAAGVTSVFIQDLSAPTVTVDAPLSVDEGGYVTLSANVLNEDLNDLTSLTWLGDGVADGNTFTFLAADNGTYTVRALVSDDSGNGSYVDVSVNVNNVAPTVSAFVDDNPVAEGSAVNVSFNGATDPSLVDLSAGLTYSFDFDGDGLYEVSGASPTASHTFGDNGTYLVRGRVSDKDGGYTDYATEVEVTNVNPTASLSLGGMLVEGGTLTVGLHGASDVSAADLAAGLTYSFDLDGDGVFEVSGSSSNVVSHLYPQDGSYTVRARVHDKDGGYSEYSGVVEVANAAPVLTGLTSSAAALGAVRQGETVTLTGSFTDAGVLDTHTAVIDWGDGTTSNAVISGGSLVGSHVYAQGGLYNVTVKVSDGKALAAGNAPAVITGVGLHNGVLQIVGTNGNDRVHVSYDRRDGIGVRGDILPGESTFSDASVIRIEAHLGEGRDDLKVDRDMTDPVYLNGQLYTERLGRTEQLVTDVLRFFDRLLGNRRAA